MVTWFKLLKSNPVNPSIAKRRIPKYVANPNNLSHDPYMEAASAIRTRLILKQSQGDTASDAVLQNICIGGDPSYTPTCYNAVTICAVYIYIFVSLETGTPV